MARENQGLQIALIIFVVLFVFMGVTTFVFVRSCDDANHKAKESDLAADTMRVKLGQAESDCKELKNMMGFPPTKTVKAIHEQFDKDMKDAFAGNWPEDARFYSPILKHLVDTIHKKDGLIAAKDDDNKTIKSEYAKFEEDRDAQVAKLDEALKKEGEDDVANNNKIEQQRTVLVEQEAAAEKKVIKVKQDDRAVVKDAQEKVAALEKQTADIVRTSRQKDAELAKLKRDHPDNFCGEISFVDLRDHTVWIDCGAADGLGRQVTFSVYSGDATDLAKATVKAKIEVTKVNEHMSMARIVDDQVTDPIVQGDKIFTPMWSPGERKHFALVGFLDLNDDGKDDHEGVKNLIKLHHGVIDCDVDDKGKINGTIAIHTNYLICGEPPGEKGRQDLVKAYTTLVEQADGLGVQKISLAELKDRMGYQNPTPVKSFGPPQAAGSANGSTGGSVPRSVKVP